jgi:hypothetical protein
MSQGADFKSYDIRSGLQMLINENAALAETV